MFICYKNKHIRLIVSKKGKKLYKYRAYHLFKGAIICANLLTCNIVDSVELTLSWDGVTKKLILRDKQKNRIRIEHIIPENTKEEHVVIALQRTGVEIYPEPPDFCLLDESALMLEADQKGDKSAGKTDNDTEINPTGSVIHLPVKPG